MSTPARYFPSFANKEKCLRAVVDVFKFEGLYVDNTINNAAVKAVYQKRGGKVKP